MDVNSDRVNRFMNLAAVGAHNDLDELWVFVFNVISQLRVGIAHKSARGTFKSAVRKTVDVLLDQLFSASGGRGDIT